MAQLTQEGIVTAVEAWELYSKEQYGRVLELVSQERTAELQDLGLLAALEVDRNVRQQPSGLSLFSPLAKGMLAYFDGNYGLASTILGTWLESKNYFSKVALERFIQSAILSGRFDLLKGVSLKFMDRQPYWDLAIHPLFLALHHLRQHKEAVFLFEKYREHFSELNLLQKAACSMIQIGRYNDGERILIALHQKITGVEYELNYEEVKSRYQDTIRRIPEMEMDKNLSPKEQMNLGMAYLFSGRYGDALRVFQNAAKEKQA